METTKQRAKRFAQIFSTSRAATNKSQEYLAHELGVTRKTIASWETGETSPSFFQGTEWFRVLGLNPMPYYLAYLYPNDFNGLSAKSPDINIESALLLLIMNLTSEQKRGLLYFLQGSYNGNTNATLQLCLAHVHLPLEFRYTIANLVYTTYKMCSARNELPDTAHMLPNIEILENAMEDAKQALERHQDGY